MRRALETQLAKIEERLERLQMLLMVREPNVGLAADAYEGLRRQVVAGSAERTAHLAQLARLDAEISRGASGEAVEMLVKDLLAEAGLVQLTEVIDGAFSITGDGDEFEVTVPAYIDQQSQRVVREGSARAQPSPSSEREAPTVPLEADSVHPTTKTKEI